MGKERETVRRPIPLSFKGKDKYRPNLKIKGPRLGYEAQVGRPEDREAKLPEEVAARLCPGGRAGKELSFLILS